MVIRQQKETITHLPSAVLDHVLDLMKAQDENYKLISPLADVEELISINSFDMDLQVERRRYVIRKI